MSRAIKTLINKYLDWYGTYQLEATWFVIGLLSFGFVSAVLAEHWSSAIGAAVLIIANYVAIRPVSFKTTKQNETE